MNYYEHHLGDYAEATSHLTFVEDAAYSRLIRKYYATERPLPADIKAAQRLVAARTPEERTAVESVLREFFELREDGWHNARCDLEIAKYQAGEPERQARRAHEEGRLQRHRDERARMFEALRAVGHAPSWNTPIATLRTLHAEYCNVSGPAPATEAATLPATAPATPATATHTPVPIHQSPSPSPQSPDTRHQTPTTNPEFSRERARANGDLAAPQPRDRNHGLTPDQRGDHMWQDVAGIDRQAMQDWIDHRAVKKPPDGLRPHERFAAAKMLAGMGAAEVQRQVVQAAIANGWNHLRHSDAKTSAGNGAANGRRTSWRPDPEEERQAQEAAARQRTGGR